MSSTYDPESLLVMKYSAMPKMHRIVRNSVASPYGCRTSKIRSACACRMIRVVPFVGQRECGGGVRARVLVPERRAVGVPVRPVHGVGAAEREPGDALDLDAQAPEHDESEERKRGGRDEAADDHLPYEAPARDARDEHADKGAHEIHQPQ